MTAPSPRGVYYELEAEVLRHDGIIGYIPLELDNLIASIDMDRVPYCAARLELRNVDDTLWRALDPRVVASPLSTGDLRFRAAQYSSDGVWQQSLPAEGLDESTGGFYADMHIREARRRPASRTATVEVAGGETMLDDKRRLAGTTIDTGATTVDALVQWSLLDVFSGYAYGADAVVGATAIPAGERRKMLQGQTHMDLLQTELDAINARLYDYWGRRWRANDRENPPTFVGAPVLVRLGTFSGRGATTTEPTYSGWTVQRTNLWGNPRAVAGGTAFANPSSGSGSYVTDMPGAVNTARRWTANGTGNTRIIPMQLGVTTPDQGERAHVRMRVRITGGSIAVCRLNVRPSDIGSATNATVQDFGTLGPGEHELELRLNTNAMTASATAGVVLTGAASAAGVTVDATEILVETITDGAYFDGAGADLELERHEWAGTPDASVSYYQTRTITGSVTIEAPSTLPSDVDPIVLDEGELEETVSRDDWADGVLVKGDYTDSAGVRQTWYQASGGGANTRGRLVTLDRPQPAGNIANAYVARAKLRGSQFTVTARIRLDVLPGMTLQLFLADGDAIAGIVRGVEWNFAAGTMSVRVVAGTPV